MSIPENSLVAVLNDSFEIELKDNITMDQLKEILAEHVNHLIDRDFNKLVSLLYRIDVNESKLRQLLDENSSYDAGRIIAGLVIERQLQKIKSREQFRTKNQNNIDENEKW
jgi:hypothetical protein